MPFDPDGHRLAGAFRRLPPDQAEHLLELGRVPGPDLPTDALAALWGLEVADATRMLSSWAEAGLVTHHPYPAGLPEPRWSREQAEEWTRQGIPGRIPAPHLPDRWSLTSEQAALLREEGLIRLEARYRSGDLTAAESAESRRLIEQGHCQGEEAVQAFHALLQAYRESGHGANEAFVWNNIGHMWFEAGEYEEALHPLQNAMVHYSRRSDQCWYEVASRKLQDAEKKLHESRPMRLLGRFPGSAPPHLSDAFRELSPDQADLVLLLGLVPGPDLTTAVFAHLLEVVGHGNTGAPSGEEAAEAHLRALADRGLAVRSPGGGLHPDRWSLTSEQRDFARRLSLGEIVAQGPCKFRLGVDRPVQEDHGRTRKQAREPVIIVVSKPNDPEGLPCLPCHHPPSPQHSRNSHPWTPPPPPRPTCAPTWPRSPTPAHAAAAGTPWPAS